MLEGVQVGSYRVLKRIGEGGMGEVWLAEHVALGRRAALKVLHPQFSARADIVKRFFNEARAATTINDPGIVQIFDFGQHTDGSAYIVMELLDGEPLDRRLARLGALEPTDALRIIRQAATTLGAAHARQIVHRDLKPENIFLVRDAEVNSGERAKILDFGIAKLVDDPSGAKTRTDSIMGTPTYMSPEQCRGAGHVDQRSDVYALGCVLFALLVGRPPFDAEGVGEIIVMHLTATPPVPSHCRPGISPELDELVLRCLAKDPSARFNNAAELAAAIGAMLGRATYLTPAPSYVSSPGQQGVARPTTLSSATGASIAMPVPGRSRVALVLGGVAIAVTVGGTFTLVARKLRNDRRMAASAPQPPTEAAAVPSSSPSAAEPPPAPVQPATATVPPPDPRALVIPLAKDVLRRIATWAGDHAGAPCPDAAKIGDLPNDPWAHPFRITCTDQPSDQRFGAISAGPDGANGTADDIASWELGAEVTSLVRGSRWVAATPKPAVRTVKKPASVAAQPITPKPATPKPTTTKPGPTPTAVQLDENGIPITR